MKVLKKSFQQVKQNQLVQPLSIQQTLKIKGGDKDEVEKEEEGCGFCTLDSDLGS